MPASFDQPADDSALPVAPAATRRVVVAAAAVFFLAAGLLIAWPAASDVTGEPGAPGAMGATFTPEAVETPSALLPPDPTTASLRERLVESEAARRVLAAERDAAVTSRDAMNQSRADALQRAEHAEASAAAMAAAASRTPAVPAAAAPTTEPSVAATGDGETVGPRPFGARTLTAPAGVTREAAAAMHALQFLERYGITTAGEPRAALDRAVTAAEAELADAPLALASARVAIGLAYQRLGDAAAAIPLLAAARTGRADALGPDHPDTIRADLALGCAEADAGLEPARARLQDALFRTGLRTGSRAGASADPLHLAAVDRLGGLHLAGGDVAAAEPFVRESWENHRATPRTTAALQAASRLADVESGRGRRAEAAELLEVVLDARRERGEDDIDAVLRLRTELTRLYCDLDRPADAMPHARFVLETRAARLGDEDARTLDALDDVARLELDLGRPADAERDFVKSLSIRERRQGPDDPRALAVQDELALVMLVRGRSEEAIDRCRATIAARQAAGTDGGWRAAFTRSTLGAALATAPEHRAEGEPLLREACLGLAAAEATPPRVRRWAQSWLRRLGLTGA